MWMGLHVVLCACGIRVLCANVGFQLDAGNNFGIHEGIDSHACTQVMSLVACTN